MIRVNKASAGSGKTYTLAHTYIDLLRDELSYRRILAVTFTNKATAEMKERILEYLAADPASRDKLVKILHDYSAFSVSTIDRFFQRTLKAFAREIGQVADYQVELDRESLIGEAMDRILDSLTDDEAQSDILGWLRENVADKLGSGDYPNMENALHEMGKRLGSAERAALRKEHGVDDGEFSRERLAAIRKSCRTIIKEFAARVKAAAQDLPVYGKKDEDKHRDEYTRVVWYKDIERPKAKLSKAAAGTPFMDLFGRPFVIYRTALVLESQVFSLGLAREFFSQFQTLLKEKGVMCLDDGNALLSRIIAGSDAPFVYEKLGVRYENFLLDEFQDTSNIQWENFLPLLRESEGGGHESLLVGDVKQSIYRWRDSDWRLLANGVQAAFPDAKVETRQQNRRSCAEVVKFNNAFFSYAARHLGLEDLYSDVEQTVCSPDPQGGHVQLSFCDKADEIAAVEASVRTALDAGARYGDIAVLVRGNAEGGAVAARLIEDGFPVVSDDSLKINSSFIVRKVLSLLGGLENPEDGINAFIAADAGVTVPQCRHSLTDLCEELLRQLQRQYPDIFRDETLFIQAFMDTLREWTEVNGDNLRWFLQYWENDKRYISSPRNSDAITVLTVHKSKGLEFPYLIFPFAEKVEIYRPTERWCWLDASGTPLGQAATGIWLVNLSEKARDTLFEPWYDEERRMQLVDNMNVFYVALTRARCCLHIIACNPPKSHTEGDCKDFSQILWDFCGALSESSRGQIYDFSKLRRKPSKDGSPFPASYVSIPLGERLGVATDAADFFGPEGVTGVDASVRRSGIVLHGILAGVRCPEDLPGAVQEALLDGQLDSAHAAEALSLLQARIASHPEFFGGGGWNESAIFDSDGSEYRPDRVVVNGGSAIVVDYKFGAHENRYAAQVRRYMRLCRSLGYSDVRGFIWYVPDDTLVPVD